MDQVDYDILRALQQNGRMTASDISKRVNLSVPAVTERMRKLEANGTIEHYTIKLNRRQLEQKLLAMVFVNLADSRYIVPFRQAVVSFAEVLECHHVAGEYDYILKVLVHDTAELESFLAERLKQIDGVQKSNTLIVLSTLKEEVNRTW